MCDKYWTSTMQRSWTKFGVTSSPSSLWSPWTVHKWWRISTRIWSSASVWALRTLQDGYCRSLEANQSPQSTGTFWLVQMLKRLIKLFFQRLSPRADNQSGIAGQPNKQEVDVFLSNMIIKSTSFLVNGSVGLTMIGLVVWFGMKWYLIYSF